MIPVEYPTVRVYRKHWQTQVGWSRHYVRTGFFLNFEVSNLVWPLKPFPSKSGQKVFFNSAPQDLKWNSPKSLGNIWLVRERSLLITFMGPVQKEPGEGAKISVHRNFKAFPGHLENTRNVKKNQLRKIGFPHPNTPNISVPPLICRLWWSHWASMLRWIWLISEYNLND